MIEQTKTTQNRSPQLLLHNVPVILLVLGVSLPVCAYSITPFCWESWLILALYVGVPIVCLLYKVVIPEYRKKHCNLQYIHSTLSLYQC